MSFIFENLLHKCQNGGIIIAKGGCASSVQVIRQGEGPCPTKRSEQSVLSLGAKTVR